MTITPYDADEVRTVYALLYVATRGGDRPATPEDVNIAPNGFGFGSYAYVQGVLDTLVERGGAEKTPDGYVYVSDWVPGEDP